jgi:hypothetical protein
VLLFVGQSFSEPLEDLVHAAETVHAANMSEDFDVAYDAIVAACGVLVSNPSPAHLLGFVYGMHRATLAAEEVHDFWSALERIDLLATEEEEE